MLTRTRLSSLATVAAATCLVACAMPGNETAGGLAPASESVDVDTAPPGDSTDPATREPADVVVDGSPVVVDAVTCEADPPRRTDGDVLGVGTPVLAVTATGSAGDEDAEVAFTRIEVDDDGELLVTYDLVEITVGARGWEGWRTEGPGAESFTSPLDDVVDVEATIGAERLDASGTVVALEDGLPTEVAVPFELSLGCEP